MAFPMNPREAQIKIAAVFPRKKKKKQVAFRNSQLQSSANAWASCVTFTGIPEDDPAFEFPHFSFLVTREPPRRVHIHSPGAAHSLGTTEATLWLKCLYPKTSPCPLGQPGSDRLR